MAFTQHGHQIIGTIAEDPSTRPPVTRCGGPTVCKKCGEDATMAQLAERLKRSDHTKTPSDIKRRAHVAAYNTIYMEIRRTLENLERYGAGIHPDTIEIHKAMVDILGRHAEEILHEGRLDKTFLYDYLDGNARRNRLVPHLNRIMGWLTNGHYLKVNHHECEALGLDFPDFRYIQDIIENETDYASHHVWIDKEELYVLAPRGISEEVIAAHGVTKMADLIDDSEGSAPTEEETSHG